VTEFNIPPTNPPQQEPSADTSSRVPLVSSQSKPILDLGEIDALRKEGPGLLKRLIGVFGESSSKAIDIIEKSFASGDLETVMSKAHMLKGSSTNFGAARLFSACESLEYAARERNKPEAEKHFESVKTEYRYLWLALQTCE